MLARVVAALRFASSSGPPHRSCDSSSDDVAADDAAADAPTPAADGGGAAAAVALRFAVALSLHLRSRYEYRTVNLRAGFSVSSHVRLHSTLVTSKVKPSSTFLTCHALGVWCQSESWVVRLA
jgi:hypothetical protein